MPRPDKVAIVEATKEIAAKANSIILANFTGIDVERDTGLRRKMREKDVDYRVIKNRLAKISFKELGYDDVAEYLVGPTSFAFGLDDPGAPVKIILEAGKKTDIPKIKAIWFEGQLFGAEDAKKIVNLPSRDQLIAQFVGGLNVPIANLVGDLNSIIRKFVGTLSAIRKKKEEE